MLVGRCSSELSGHRLHANLKSHSLRAERLTDLLRDTALLRGAEEPVPNVAEGTPAALVLPMPPGAFQPPKPEIILAKT